MENLHTCIISFQFSVYILVLGFSIWCIRAMAYDSEGLVDEWDESTPSPFLADRFFNLLSWWIVRYYNDLGDRNLIPRLYC
ncbi:hypothetical protein EYC80_001740 [Monilinia laxa]|uniref:Uncharacterized protein n=1 Tax=Monilinia laxa TaxID=61186 RepID=A0A5N6K5X2_MONLA|nr:hypothetical protein EYC80_001740 [Monilinia laxa]